MPQLLKSSILSSGLGLWMLQATGSAAAPPDCDPPPLNRLDKQVMSPSVRKVVGQLAEVQDQAPGQLLNKKYDPADPVAYQRLVAAIDADPKVRTLVRSVLSEVGVSELKDFMQIRKPGEGHPFEQGDSLVEVLDPMPGGLISGWPAIDENGMLVQGRRPNLRFRATMKTGPGTEFETFLNVIHEMTHLKANIAKAKATGIDRDILSFKGAGDYVEQLVSREGGEADAFIAQISAGIRYRLRTGADYASFHTAGDEKFFDDKTGEVRDREGLVKRFRTAGGKFSYQVGYERDFRDLVQSDLEWIDSNVKILKSNPNYVTSPEYRELARRLLLRAEVIRKRFLSEEGAPK